MCVNVHTYTRTYIRSGNSIEGDGCSENCKIEEDFTCRGIAPSVCTCEGSVELCCSRKHAVCLQLAQLSSSGSITPFDCIRSVSPGSAFPACVCSPCMLSRDVSVLRACFPGMCLFSMHAFPGCACSPCMLSRDVSLLRACFPGMCLFSGRCFRP
jgi:hypothetical protein